MTTPASRIEAIAGELHTVAAQVNHLLAAGNAMEPHPDTLAVLSSRSTTRSQIHPNVPDALDLPDRIRAFAREQRLNQGDAAALILDTYLRAAGYPPQLTDRP